MLHITRRRFDLKLTHRWTIASKLGPGGGGGMDDFPVVFVEVTDGEGLTGLGEAAPSTRYGESVDTVEAFLARVDPGQLSFEDVPASMRYLDTLGSGQAAPKGALNLALVDGAAQRAGLPVHEYLGLPFLEKRYITSFSIGIDEPDRIRQKVEAAAEYPVLKLKVGVAHDRANLAALRAAAPLKPVRVDANEAWKTKEEALRHMDWLAEDGHIEFVEQPMPADAPAPDWAWLKDRSPLPIVADESYHTAADASFCADCFHGVNVKLMKAGGISAAFDALRSARQAGLKTMIGCMIESSILISAGAHLADLADHLDLDGNLLIDNDPYLGATANKGLVSFASAPRRTGLRVAARG